MKSEILPSNMPSGRRWQTLVPLLFVLAIALAIRLILYTGLIRGDDFSYAHAAFELSQGRTHFDFWSEGTQRIGLYLPVAIIYRLFGISSFTTVLFPLLCSLTTAFFIYLIADKLNGASAGILAAMLWAIFPLDIFLATDLLPDGPLAAFTTASMYFLLIAEQNSDSKKRIACYAICTFLLFYAYLIKPLALATILILPFYFLYRLLRRDIIWHRIDHLRRQPAAVVISLAILGLLVLQYTRLQEGAFVVLLYRTSSDLLQLLVSGITNFHSGGGITTHTNMYVGFSPLLLVSVFYLLRARKGHHFIYLWAGFAYFFFEFGSIATNPLVYYPFQDWLDGRNLLYLFPPLVILIGLYLSQWYSADSMNGFLVLWGIFVVGFAALLANTFPNPVVSIVLESAILIGILLTVLMPALSNLKTTQWMPLLTSAMLVIYSVGMITPFPPHHYTFHLDRQTKLRGLYEFAQSILEDENSLILTDSADFEVISFAFRFRLNYDWAGQYSGREERLGLLENYSGDLETLQAYLIFFESASTPPPRATLVAREVLDGETLFRIYRLEGGQTSG